MVAWRRSGVRGYLSSFFHFHHFKGKLQVGRLSTSVSKREQRTRLVDSINSLDHQHTADVEVCVNLLQTCTKFRALEEGRRVHSYIRRVGLCDDVFLSNHLVMMYGKCGSLDEARAVFRNISRRNVFSWTILITVCTEHGLSREALALFYEMLEQGIRPHGATFTAALGACNSPEHILAGKALHAQICSYGFQSGVIVATSLVSMYSKCGDLEAAVRMFNSMTETNVVSWNALIAAYADHKRGAEALRILQRMLLEGMKTCNLTYVSLMSAYDEPSHLGYAKYVHRCIIESGFEQDVTVGTTLVNMYAKCSGLQYARRAFDRLRHPNTVTFNVLISAYAQHGYHKEAVNFFRKMLLLGLELDEVTFINVLAACCTPGSLADGRVVHACVLEHPRASEDVGLEAVILNMYGKCGSIQDAEAMFGVMRDRDLVAWNTMIAAYSQQGHTREALQLYERMLEDGMEPDDFTHVSVLDACATLGALEEGKAVHKRLGERATHEIALANSLVNMYGKCGIVDIARSVFDKAEGKVPVTWNAMIGGYAQHGHEDDAFELLLLMRLDGTEPSYITFISILSACANAGLPEKGHGYFVSMQEDHGLQAGASHYGSMVEALGKAGRLVDAESLIRDMPHEPDVLVWTSFLANCRSHGDMQRGKLAATSAIALDPDVSAAYVALARIHADAGEFDEASKIRKMMLDRGVRKNAGRSMIKLGSSIYEFTVGDQSNPRSKEIFDELRKLDKEMKLAGYDPDMKTVAHDVNQEQKEPLLFAHSERLAIAFGIISTPPGTPIRVLKNLRVCGDCHTVTKLTSKITGREIIVRDSNRFHHFKDGVCSCKDYW